MNILVATGESQGLRDDDFMNAVAGELVVDAGPCQDVTSIDDWSCACARGFLGIASNQLTTTVKVVDTLRVGIHDYESAVVNGVGSWCCPDCALEIARASLDLAARWPVGTILERWRTAVSERVPV